MGKFLFAAYAATWLIHLGYLGILGRGYKRVKADLDEERRETARMDTQS
jgi:hypothetical protein